MRIVLTAQPGYSHLAPAVLPVARLARDAGHEVAIATATAMREHVASAGLDFLPLPGVIPMHEISQHPDIIERIGIDFTAMDAIGQRTIDTGSAMLARGFAGVFAERVAVDLIPALEEYKPDLVLREITEFGGYLAAEALGIPSGALDIAPCAPYTSSDVLAQINANRTAFGLSTVDDPTHPVRGLRAGLVPRSFYPERHRTPSTHHYRPVPAAGGPTTGGQLDPAIADLPGDRPLVLASLGSNAARYLDGGPSLLDRIVEALGRLPVRAVVALGAGNEPEHWPGPHPDNVHLTSFVQQELLLPTCDAFITHAGFNGTREALTAGVPMVAVPLFAEQPANADRIAEIGVGKRLNAEDATAEALTGAVRAVLTEPGYAHRAGWMHRQVLAQPPLERLLDDLAEFAG